MGYFPFVPQSPPPRPQYVPTPVTEHVSLHSKSLCKNVARASGGGNNLHPLSGGGAQTEKIQNSLFILNILGHIRMCSIRVKPYLIQKFALFN